ncbi:MAG: hypothetical protein IPL70_00330 [Uliginosibacterium sp.]|nr:hypothetical protein [Uliginosibacterium sp.]
MPTRAPPRFHADKHRREIGKEIHHLAAFESLGAQLATLTVDTMYLKYSLCQIQPDYLKLETPLRSVVSDNSLWLMPRR